MISHYIILYFMSLTCSSTHVATSCNITSHYMKLHYTMLRWCTYTCTSNRKYATFMANTLIYAWMRTCMRIHIRMHMQSETHTHTHTRKTLAFMPNHYMTSHYITLYWATSHYVQILYITLRCITLHYILLRHISSQLQQPWQPAAEQTTTGQPQQP